MTGDDPDELDETWGEASAGEADAGRSEPEGNPESDDRLDSGHPEPDDHSDADRSESDDHSDADRSEPDDHSDADRSESDDTPDDAPESNDGRPDDVRNALAEIRREQYKVAVVHASLEAAVVALGVNLLVGVASLPALDATVLASVVASSGVPAPDLGTLLALLAGVAAFAAGVGLRVRRPAAESFEAANPEVAEALRTARDSVRDGRANPVALALYDDVLDRLGETSSVGLLDTTRLAATVLLAFALSLASVQTAVVGLDLAGPPSDAAVGGAGDSGVDRAALANGSTPTLQDGDELLGDPSEVDTGSENLTASVGSSPGGEGEQARNYDRDGGGSDGGAVAPERAGFDSPERVEDADLVARYARELGGNQTDD